MNALIRIAGTCFALLGAALIVLVGWDLLAPADSSPASAPAGTGVLSSLVLGVLWLAAGVWLLRRKPRQENAR